MDPIIKLTNVSYKYSNGSATVHAVKDANGDFYEGKMYAITGRSGSGKTTIMSLMAGLDLPQDGDIFYMGKSILKENRDKYRQAKVGMIFQSFNLLPQLTALENVMISLELCGYKVSQAKTIAMKLLLKVGLTEETAVKRVLKLSGGEQQRVAIARALGPNPPLILADEPTGNLDSENGKNILDILSNLAHVDNRCVVIITHTKEIASECDVVLEMKDGRII